MTAKIMIQRRVAKGLEVDLAPLLAQLRYLARRCPGYLGGETLRNADDPEQQLVISNWASLSDWERWVESQERQAVQKDVDDLLGEPTWYQVFIPEDDKADL
jgi:heme-degrading monooxygenase HmoA